MCSFHSSIRSIVYIILLFPLFLPAQESPTGPTITGSMLSVSGLNVSEVTENLLRGESRTMCWLSQNFSMRRAFSALKQIPACNFLSVTAAGVKTLKEIHPVIMKNRATALNGVDPREPEVLKKNLQTSMQQLIFKI